MCLPRGPPVEPATERGRTVVNVLKVIMYV